MRDLILLGVVLAGALVALRRPWIGVLLFTWLSVMNPHDQFSWRAASWPLAMIAALATMLGLLVTRDRHNPLKLGAPVWFLLAFVAWICVTLPFSIYFEDSRVLWERSMKIYLMIFVTMALLNSRERIDAYLWVIVVSLGFFGFKGGIFTVLTGGNYRVWGPGGFIEGNNELALALVMTIPLMRYLQLQSSRRLVRHVLTLAMVLTAITVLGTHSRGALLAIVGMLTFLWWRSSRKALLGVLLFGTALLVLPLMPEQWWDRMATIREYDQDLSALGRINAWWTTWNLATDRFFGGGFMIYTAGVFAQYAPDPSAVHAAHSIYFQVLGEHGFVGLAIFLAIGASTWRAAQRLYKLGAADPARRWASDLGAMVQVSMAGYAVGGAFLSLAYFDLPYSMLVVVTVAEAVVAGRIAPWVAPAALGRRGLRGAS